MSNGDQGIERLVEQAREKWKAMTPAERAAMLGAQRRSWVLAEAGFGTDADEAAFRSAMEQGDEQEMARLDREAEARMTAAACIMDGMAGA